MMIINSKSMVCASLSSPLAKTSGCESGACGQLNTSVACTSSKAKDSIVPSGMRSFKMKAGLGLVVIDRSSTVIPAAALEQAHKHMY